MTGKSREGGWNGVLPTWALHAGRKAVQWGERKAVRSGGKRTCPRNSFRRHLEPLAGSPFRMLIALFGFWASGALQ